MEALYKAAAFVHHKWTQNLLSAMLWLHILSHVAWLVVATQIGNAAGTGDSPMGPLTTFFIALELLITAAIPLVEGIALTVIGGSAPLLWGATWLAAALAAGNLAVGVTVVVTLVQPQNTFNKVQIIDPLQQVLGALFAIVELLLFLAATGSARGNARAFRVAAQGRVIGANGWVAGFALPPSPSPSVNARCGFITVGFVSVLLLSALLSFILPPGWSNAAETLLAYAVKPTEAEYVVLNPHTLLDLGGLGTYYVKAYIDVVVYWSVLGGLLTIGLAGVYLPWARRVLALRLRLPNCARSLYIRDELPVGVISLGEATLTAGVLGVFVFWAYYWGVLYSRITADASVKYDDPYPSTHIAARTLGHMTTLSLSLLTFPVVKNSVWETVYGVPYERALRFHRALGLVCWGFVTSHMLTWWCKWGAQGVLWHNIFATGTPDLLIISIGKKSGEVHSHHNNPTIPIVTAAWVLLTLALGFAMARRYVRFETFQYTHVAVLFFVFAAEIHAWSHWYHSLGGLALYAFDKAFRTARGSVGHVIVAATPVDNVTLLTVQLPSGSRVPEAGQYYFVNLPGLSTLEWHPITVVSVSVEAADAHRTMAATARSKLKLGEAADAHNGAALLLAPPATSTLNVPLPLVSPGLAACDPVSLEQQPSTSTLDEHTAGGRPSSSPVIRVTFAIKSMGEGTWTGRLHAAAAQQVEVGGRPRAAATAATASAMPSSIATATAAEAAAAASATSAPVVDDLSIAHLDGPYGCLPARPTDGVQHAICIAGGIGVTPFHALLVRALQSAAQTLALAHRHRLADNDDRLARQKSAFSVNSDDDDGDGDAGTTHDSYAPAHGGRGSDRNVMTTALLSADALTSTSKHPLLSDTVPVGQTSTSKRARGGVSSTGIGLPSCWISKQRLLAGSTRAAGQLQLAPPMALTLVWSVVHPYTLGLFAETLCSALDATEAGWADIRLHIHVTGRTSTSDKGGSGGATSTSARWRVEEWPAVQSGLCRAASAARIAAYALEERPNLNELLFSHSTPIMRRGGGGGRSTRVGTGAPPTGHQYSSAAAASGGPCAVAGATSTSKHAAGGGPWAADLVRRSIADEREYDEDEEDGGNILLGQSIPSVSELSTGSDDATAEDSRIRSGGAHAFFNFGRSNSRGMGNSPSAATVRGGGGMLAEAGTSSSFASVCDEKRRTVVFVCGPAPLADAAAELALAGGWGFHSEVFHI